MQLRQKGVSKPLTLFRICFCVATFSPFFFSGTEKEMLRHSTSAPLYLGRALG